MISLKNIALRRGPRLLFEGVNLQIHRGERIGIVGDNGSGKSSLFSMLLGDIGADQGEIQIPRDELVAHVSQQTPATDQAAIEYVLDGDPVLRELESRIAEAEAENNGRLLAECYEEMERINGYGAPARAARLLAGLGFSTSMLEQPTRSFSGGWRVRLNLAQALMCPSDMLLLDEPTNHLDLDAVVWLEDWLAAYQGTLLLISHDRDFLDTICRRILHLEQGRIRSYSGNYSRFEHTRAEMIATEQAAYARQQRAISHMQSFVTRFKAKATKARQAQSRIKALERMQVIAPAHIDSPFRFSFAEAEVASDPLLKVSEVDAGYGDQLILRKIGFSIAGQDRIALVGPNGAGKSTLIKLLAGTLEKSAGELIGAKGLKTGYFAQHQLEQLDPECTPMTQLTQLYPRENPQTFRNFLGGFGFSGDRVNERIGPFSGGEKARLALAILIFSKPNLLLMDEPTNHLDLEMRHALSIAFQQYSGALVLVSHDRHLIRTVTDQLWLVHEGGVREFNDDIDGYLDWARKSAAMDDALGSASHPGIERSRSPTLGKEESPRQSKKEKRQQAARLREKVRPLSQAIRKSEQRVDQLQEETASLEKILADPETYETESTARLAEMMQQKSTLERQIADEESRWLELAEELETVNRNLSGAN